MTVDNIVDRGFRTVKIWPKHEQLAYNNELDPVFNDDRISVVVFRPFYNQISTFDQSAAAGDNCGGGGFAIADIGEEDENNAYNLYGQVAELLYQMYGTKHKTVILTGWEADNQISHLPIGNPWCMSGWPPQSTVDLFTKILEDRQIGVEQARLAHPNANLRVFHAVEVRTVPTAPGPPGNPGFNVLERVVPVLIQNGHPPDFISYSSWTGTVASLASRLDTIASVTGLTNARDRIFVGERGCEIGSPNRANCFSDHAAATFNWGARLWFVWTFNEGPFAGQNGHDLVYGPDPANPDPGGDTPNGFSVLNTVRNTWATTYKCGNHIFADSFESGNTAVWSAAWD